MEKHQCECHDCTAMRTRERLYVLGNVARAERTRKIYAAVYGFYDLVERVTSSEMDVEGKIAVIGDAQHDFEDAIGDLV